MVVGALALLLVSGLPAGCQNKPVPPEKICKNAAGVAVGGYDVVSYFSAKKAERGSPLIAVKRDGAEYRFVSVQHRDQFNANPVAYLPQYGGHCAYAMSKGKPMTGDPEAWLIHRGRLYLTVSREALAAFQMDLSSAIRQADEIWKRLY